MIDRLKAFVVGSIGLLLLFLVACTPGQEAAEDVTASTTTAEVWNPRPGQSAPVEIAGPSRETSGDAEYERELMVAAADACVEYDMELPACDTLSASEIRMARTRRQVAALNRITCGAESCP